MRRTAAGVGVAIALVVVGLTVSNQAAAAAFSGTFGPTIYNGLADVDGNGVVNGNDDSNAFFGSTNIINGGVDCNAWGATVNSGAAGDNVINGNDNCSLLAYDGTADGAPIEVASGSFSTINGAAIANGTPLPHVFPNPATPANNDIGDSRFAWSAINGRVDANGNETIEGSDCTNDLVGSANVLSNAQVAECGFVAPPAFDVNGLVDLNDDFTITSADSCASGCFFRHNVTNGVVQAEGPSITPSPSPSPSPSPTPSPTPVTPVIPRVTALTISDGGFNVGPRRDCHFVVSLDPGSNTTVTVNYAATATNARQIAPLTGTLVFTPGQTTKTIVVDVLNRRRRTGHVEVTLSGASGATITDGVGRCTIKARPAHRR
jgi:hypothetical protein